MKDVLALLTALFRFALAGQPLPQQTAALLTAERAEQLYKLANRHDLAPLAAEALLAAGLLPALPPELAERFRRSRLTAVYRREKRQYEWNRLSSALEAAGVPYLPLKGMVLQTLWPQPWLRTCHDVDLLVPAEQMNAAMAAMTSRLHYQKAITTNHDVTYRAAPSGVLVELHHSLLDATRATPAARTLAGIWQHTLPGERPCERQLDFPMFFTLHVAHMAEHFEQGGCGMRPFADLWLLTRRTIALEEAEQTAALLKDAGLAPFARAAFALAERWFTGEAAAPDHMLDVLEGYVVTGGVYGSVLNRIAVTGAAAPAQPGTRRYFAGRLFWPYDRLKTLYPVLLRHRWLLPVMQVRRWCQRIHAKGLAPFLAEARLTRRVNAAMTETSRKELVNLRAYLGL